MKKVILKVLFLTVIFVLTFKTTCISGCLSIDERMINTTFVEQKQVVSPIDKLIKSIMKHETNNGTFMYNNVEDAVGYLQIRKIMVYDVNKIIGSDKYSLNDRWDSIKSIEIFKIYQNHYNPKWNFEKAARIWNGGPTGLNKTETVKYWSKVKEFLKEQNT